MEIGTHENESIVRAVCDRVLAATAADKPVSPSDQLIYDIDYLVMEANSGDSYEQYFRWATTEAIVRVVPALRGLGLDEVATLTEQAIAIAFPRGVPGDPSAKSEATNWSNEQEKTLHQLFKRMEEHNGRITNVLGRYASSVEA